MATGNQVIQGYQRVEDRVTGDETLVFKYVIDGETSQPVKYKILYPLGDKISGSFLSAVMASIGDAVECVLNGESGRRLSEALSEENLNIVARELYSFLEKHYLFNGLSKKQLVKTICRESMIITVPYSEKIIFVYKGHSCEGNASINLRINEGMVFYGVFNDNTFYFTNPDELAEFAETDYGVKLSTIEELKRKMISDIRSKLKKRIRGNAASLPYQRLGDELHNQLQREYMQIASSYYASEKETNPDQYLYSFPSLSAEARIFETACICDYLHDLNRFIAREAERHIKENWEVILYHIEQHRLVSSEISRLMATEEFG